MHCRSSTRTEEKDKYKCVQVVIVLGLVFSVLAVLLQFVCVFVLYVCMFVCPDNAVTRGKWREHSRRKKKNSPVCFTF